MGVVLLLAVAVCVCACVSLWRFTTWHYWKVRGVPYLEPVLPVFGNIPDLLLLRTLPDTMNRIYRETKGYPYIGIYAFHTPVLFVRDLDLAARMLINDFNHFGDRGFHSNEQDPLGKNLIHQNGSEWKFFRSKVTDSFNSKKVTAMFPTMQQKSELLLEVIEDEQSKHEAVETYDASLRLAIDVLAVSALGVEANTLQDKNAPFNEIANHMLGLYFIFHVFTACFFTKVHSIFRIAVAKPRVTKFFDSIVKHITSYRKETSCPRKDVFQKLYQSVEEHVHPGSEDSQISVDHSSIVGQIYGIFLAGFESIGNIIACSLYELAKNPQIQRALHTEITEVLNVYDNEVSLDALQHMKYLHQIISECLRMYTPLPLIFRRCTKDYTIPGTSTVVERGTMVLVPLRGILADPEYYPDPGVFDPERFSEGNCRARAGQAAVYMPFGIGPRVCPAVVYSFIEIKTTLVYILKQFEVQICNQTPTHFQPSPFKFLMAPKNGLHLSFRRREIKN